MLTSLLRRTFSTSFRRPPPHSGLFTAANCGGDRKPINDAAANDDGDTAKLTPNIIAPPANKAAHDGREDKMSIEEVKRIMRIVNVEELKRKLGEEGKEVISYGELLRGCHGLGIAKSVEEAVMLAELLDEAGVILLFRHKVYLHPHKVVELVSSSVPLALTREDDPRREELKRLQERKEEIDRQAHKQVRVILWSGLGIAVMQVGLFFRLTFWEFSWDVMEPVAFFTTATGLVISYGYFMMTSRDPTYQDLMKRLFMSRQRKLLKKYHFDIARFKELSDKCRCPSDKKHSGDNLVL